MKALFFSSLVGLALLLSATLSAQLPSIDSLRIIPNSPAAGDQIRLICYTTFSTGDCELTNHTTHLIDTTVIVSLNYTVGDYAAICHSTDTLVVGNLYSNNYMLTANLSKNLETVIYDTDTVRFTIEALGLVDSSNDENDLAIYPNPIVNEVYIERNSSMRNIIKVELFSILGQKLLVKEGINSTKTKIRIEHLINGIYFLNITSAESKYWTKRIIKNAPY